MSQIFDALLRSEAERSGRDLSGLSGADALLRLAERQATTKGTTAALLDQRDIADDLESRTRINYEVASISPDTLAIPQEAAPLAADRRPDIVEQFQSLNVSPSSNSRLVCLTDPESPTAEAFRLLVVRLRNLRRQRTLKKVLITSTIPKEGKSTVSANLACALAQNIGERTLLVEGDLRLPAEVQIFGLGSLPGICEWLQGQDNVPTNIYHLEKPNLWILPAGSAGKTPLELMQSPRLPLLMEQLSAQFDWIVIDSPPVLPLADTSIWTRMADGVLLVTRQGISEKKQMERGLQALPPEKLIGALLNCSSASAYDSYYYRPSKPA
jgi:capsular exopolysaccharide synthesis family protein